jgi:hypothetical protein
MISNVSEFFFSCGNIAFFFFNYTRCVNQMSSIYRLYNVRQILCSVLDTILYTVFLKRSYNCSIEWGAYTKAHFAVEGKAYEIMLL